MANALEWIVGSPWLYRQDFESGTEPAGWTHSGTPNYAYTPALLGNFSLAIPSTDTPITSYTLTQLYGTLFGFFLFETTGIPSTNTSFFTTTAPDSSNLISLILRTDGTVRISDGVSVSADTVDAMSINTLYYVWWKYSAGNGANGVGTVGYSINATEPTTGNKFASFNNSTLVTPIRKVLPLDQTVNATTFIYDAFIVSLTDVGSNPI